MKLYKNVNISDNMKDWIQLCSGQSISDTDTKVTSLSSSLSNCMCLWICFHLMFFSFYQATLRLWLSLQEPGESKLWRTNLHIAFWVMMIVFYRVYLRTLRKITTPHVHTNTNNMAISERLVAALSITMHSYGPTIICLLSGRKTWGFSGDTLKLRYIWWMPKITNFHRQSIYEHIKEISWTILGTF